MGKLVSVQVRSSGEVPTKPVNVNEIVFLRRSRISPEGSASLFLPSWLWCRQGSCLLLLNFNVKSFWRNNFLGDLIGPCEVASGPHVLLDRVWRAGSHLNYLCIPCSLSLALYWAHRMCFDLCGIQGSKGKDSDTVIDGHYSAFENQCRWSTTALPPPVTPVFPSDCEGFLHPGPLLKPIGVQPTWTIRARSVQVSLSLLFG